MNDRPPSEDTRCSDIVSPLNQAPWMVGMRTPKPFFSLPNPAATNCLGVVTTDPNCLPLAEVIVCESLPNSCEQNGRTGWDYERLSWR